MLSTTTITGHLTQTPQLRQTPTGKTVTTLRIAVNDHQHLKSEVRYIDVDQWDQAATAAVEHLVKGQQLTAEGLLDARAYLDKDHQPQIGWTLRSARTEWGARPQSS